MSLTCGVHTQVSHGLDRASGDSGSFQIRDPEQRRPERGVRTTAGASPQEQDQRIVLPPAPSKGEETTEEEYLCPTLPGTHPTVSTTPSSTILEPSLPPALAGDTSPLVSRATGTTTTVSTGTLTSTAHSQGALPSIIQEGSPTAPSGSPLQQLSHQAALRTSVGHAALSLDQGRAAHEFGNNISNPESTATVSMHAMWEHLSRAGPGAAQGAASKPGSSSPTPSEACRPAHSGSSPPRPPRSAPQPQPDGCMPSLSNKRAYVCPSPVNVVGSTVTSTSDAHATRSTVTHSHATCTSQSTSARDMDTRAQGDARSRLPRGQADRSDRSIATATAR